MLKKHISLRTIVFLLIIILVSILSWNIINEKLKDVASTKEINEISVAQKLPDNNLGELKGNSIVEQTFISQIDSFDKIEIMVGTYNRNNFGIINYKLEDEENNKIISTGKINASQLIDNKFNIFSTDKIQHAKNKLYKITLETNMEGTSAITFFCSSFDSYKDGTLFVNGEQKNNDIAFEVESTNVGQLLTESQYKMISVILMIVFITSLIMVFYFRKSYCTTFAISAFLIGLIYIVIVPPFNNLDEYEHYYRAFEVSEFKMTGTMIDNKYGNYIPKSLLVTVYDTREGHNGQYKLKDIETGFKVTLDSENRIFFRNAASSYPPTVYLPQALGMDIARIFTNSPLVMMYFARLFGLLAYVAIGYAALRIIPIKKALLYVIAMSPMAMLHAAAISADTLTNGFAMLFSAYILYLSYDKSVERISKKQVGIALLLAASVCLTKIVYFPLLLLFFLIPAEKFENKKQYIKSFIVVALGAMVILMIWNIMSINSLKISDVRLNSGTSTTGQIKYILLHPISYILTMLNTIIVEWQDFLMMMFGIQMTIYGIEMPNFIEYIFLMLIIFLGVFRSPDEKQIILGKISRWILILINLSIILLIFTAMYVGATNVGSNLIIGIQGRYFIPILFTMGFSLYSIKQIKVNKKIYEYIPLVIHCILFYMQLVMINFFV